MTTITAAAGGGAWATGATWVGGVAPTSADDVLLTATSGNVTSIGACRSCDCFGYVGTLSHAASTTWTIGDGTAGSGNIALRLVSGMTYTKGGTSSSAILFASTSATQQTIYSGGKSLGNVTIQGAGCSYISGDNTTLATTATLDVDTGTFDFGGFTHSWGAFNSSHTNTRTVTMGSSAVAITGTSLAWTTSIATNLTITANTATVTLSGAAATFSGSSNFNGMSLVLSGSGVMPLTSSGSTFQNLTRTGTAIKTDGMTLSGNITVTSTCTLNGNSSINRIFVSSTVIGTTRTVTAAVFVGSNVGFQDITCAGAGAPFTGTGISDCLGNSGITFTTAVTRYWIGGAGNWSDTTHWSTTSGGSTGASVPLSQDTARIDANSLSGVQSIVMDMPRLCKDLDMTGNTRASGFGAGGFTVSLFGSLKLEGGYTVNNVGLQFCGRSSHTLTSAGGQLGFATIFAPGGTYTLVDALTSPGALTVTAGTLNTAGFTVTCLSVFVSAFLVTANSTFNLTGTTAISLFGSPTGSVTTGGTSIFNIVNASANARSVYFSSGSFMSGTTFNYTVAGSTGKLNLGLGNGIATWGTINFSDASNARTLTVFSGQTAIIAGTFNVNGTAGKLMTIDASTPGTPAALSKASGNVICDYLSIQDITATGGAAWYAGNNSTNVSGNTGWVFGGLITATLSDLQGLSDSQALSYLKTLSDTQGLIDSIISAEGYSIVLSDLQGLSDAIGSSVVVSAPVRGGNQTIFDQLVSQGYVTGTIMDRERARLLALTGVTPVGHTLQDLYRIAGERPRLV